MFARGTKITTRRRSTIARTTISAVEVSDRVRFSPSKRDASEDGTRRLSLAHLRTAGRSRPAKEETSPGRTVYDPMAKGQSIDQPFEAANSRRPGGGFALEAHGTPNCPRPSRHSAGSGEPCSSRRYQPTTSTTPTPPPYPAPRREFPTP